MSILKLGAKPAAGIHVDSVDACTGLTLRNSRNYEAAGLKILDVPWKYTCRPQQDPARHFQDSVERFHLFGRCDAPFVKPIHAVHDDGNSQ